jgi:hypothetical protein
MTPQEFKAWFDGFTEAFTGVPTKAQWARVKERVAEIDGKRVTERIYVDRYLPTYPPRYYGPYWASYSSSGNGLAGNATTLLAGNSLSTNAANAFCSSQAMADLGRADAQALAA